MPKKVYLELYNPDKTYILPTGEPADVNRILIDHPGILEFQFLIETDEAGELFGGIMLFNRTKSECGLPLDTPDEEAIAHIAQVMYDARNPVPMPTPEERMAAQAELQNIMELPDVEVENEPEPEKGDKPLKSMAVTPELVQTKIAGVTLSVPVDTSGRVDAMSDPLLLYKLNYARHLWSAPQVSVLVGKGVITPAQYKEITGAVFEK